jgi:hypothetical protein
MGVDLKHVHLMDTYLSGSNMLNAVRSQIKLSRIDLISILKRD